MARKNLAQHEYRENKLSFEKISLLPSETVPDETLTIKEIVKKHVRGQRIAEDMMRTPVYDSGADYDSEDLEKLKHADLFDQEEIKNSLQQKIQENKQKQKNFLTEKKKEEEAKRQGEPRPADPEPGKAPASTTKKPTKEAPREDEPGE